MLNQPILISKPTTYFGMCSATAIFICSFSPRTFLISTLAGIIFSCMRSSLTLQPLQLKKDKIITVIVLYLFCLTFRFDKLDSFPANNIDSEALVVYACAVEYFSPTIPSVAAGIKFGNLMHRMVNYYRG